MFRLFDFSSTIDLPTDQLVVAAIYFMFLTGVCAYLFYHREWEARRQVEVAKLWGKKVEDDAKELQRTKLWVVVAGSVCLVLCLLVTARFCVELLRRL